MSAVKAPSIPITQADKIAFAEDGVICLRKLISARWVSKLRRAADEVLAHPDRTMDFTPMGEPGRFVTALFLWRFHKVFYDFVHTSGAASVAGALMGSSKINLFADHLLVKEPGTRGRTDWHHDLPFWPLQGTQICTIWLALDPVTQSTGGMEFVAGSHRFAERYRPVRPYCPEITRKRHMDLPQCPSFDEKRNEFRIVRWDLEPGDCLVFNVLTIHGAPGNSSSTTRRRGLATRWCGDDVTFVEGNFMVDLPVSPGIKTGDPMDSELFPVLWRAQAPI